MSSHSPYMDIFNVSCLKQAISNFPEKGSIDELWQAVAVNARWVIPARRTCILSKYEDGLVETIIRVSKGKVLPPLVDTGLPKNDCITQILQSNTPQWLENCTELLNPIDPLRKWLASDNPQIIYAMPLSSEPDSCVVLFDLIPGQYSTSRKAQIITLASLYIQYVSAILSLVKSSKRLIEKSYPLESRKLNLIDASHQAGVAEITTGVLHNVGNVLNSVNVSASLLQEKIYTSRPERLSQVCELLESNVGKLDNYLEKDTKGQQILPYLKELGKQTLKQNEEFMIEIKSLQTSVEHIKSIISAQQNFAKPIGIIQRESLVELINNVIDMSNLYIRGYEVKVIKKLQVLEPIRIDRHRIMQILLNLLSNAKQAMTNTENHPRLIIELEKQDDNFMISITDNGIGIDKKDINNIFNHGFTTKSDGHGFGLHNSALTAIEMNGSLECDSAGINQGAVFTLTLPLSLMDSHEMGS